MNPYREIIETVRKEIFSVLSDMDNKLTAYNSKVGRVMLVVLDLALLIAAILSVKPFDAHIIVTVLLTAAFIGVAVITVRILAMTILKTVAQKFLYTMKV